MPCIILFGGSFNPVHCGHIHAARAAMASIGADRLVFIPAGRPPLREKPGLAPGVDRLAMVRAAIAGLPAMDVSDLEVARGGPSYTVETVEHLLRQLGPAPRLVFLLGADCLAHLPGWKGIDRLHQLLRFAILPRNGLPVPERDSPFIRVPMKPSALSSTQVREAVAAQKPLKGLVPDAVADYIHTHRLYQAQPALAPAHG